MRYLPLAFMLIFIFSGCFDDLTGFPGASQNIKDAKKRHVFVREYYSYPNPYKINDSLSIVVHEAWLEHRWHYPKDHSSAVVGNGYQLCINSDKKSIENLSYSWSIGYSSEFYLRPSSKNSFIGDFKVYPQDTIVYPVISGQLTNDTTHITLIGKFSIFSGK